MISKERPFNEKEKVEGGFCGGAASRKTGGR